MNIHDFLGAEQAGEGTMRFAVPRELHGAFGGAFGGVVASCVLLAARSVAPGRVPCALDCRFVRGLPAGGATATASVIRGGRSLSTVSVDLNDENGVLATRGTVSLVDPAALADARRPSRTPPVFDDYESAKTWPAMAPIINVLHPRPVGHGGTAIRIPWEPGQYTAEAASLAGDVCVGWPLGTGFSGEPVTFPNPDISLRFCGDIDTDVITGVGVLERADGGVAAINIEVWSDAQIVAIGSSTALLLPVG